MPKTLTLTLTSKGLFAGSFSSLVCGGSRFFFQRLAPQNLVEYLHMFYRHKPLTFYGTYMNHSIIIINFILGPKNPHLAAEAAEKRKKCPFEPRVWPY